MTWVAWRQQRTETLIAVGILVAVAVLLLPSGIEMASAYRHDGIASCVGAHPAFACDEAIHSFESRFSSLSGLLGWLTLLPGLVGVLLAAPFVLQLESGAYRLDWTQSITRRRWIAVKLGLALTAALLLSFAFIALVTWWRTPLVHVSGRMENSVFDSEGIVAIGYTLFALGLALAIGVLWKRAVAALMVAFVVYFATRLFVDTWLRQRLTPPASLTWPISKHEPAALLHAWVISERPSDRLGNPVALHFLGQCRQAGNAKRCLDAQMPPYVHAIFEPASRFWSMQAAEFGVFTGAALVLIGFAAWWTARRA